jgi:hypothetical protein
MGFIKSRKSKDSKPPKQKVSKDNMNSFILKFNELMKSDKFSANTVLDNIPYLNEREFKLVKEKAREMGYDLIQFDDNYNTVTYKLNNI